MKIEMFGTAVRPLRILLKVFETELPLKLLKNRQTRNAVITRLSKWPPTSRLVDHAWRHRIIHRLRYRGLVPAWSAAEESPLALYDAQGAKVGDKLYLFGGYRSLDKVSDKILVFDFAQQRWATAERPSRLAHSHMAVCSDGCRFIYAVSGQHGAQCRPAISDGFSFDAQEQAWRDLPQLPASRYAGTMQLLGNRLHFVGGALPDRYTASNDHWSLAVKEGRALESYWREEPPIPLAAMHRGSAVIGNRLYTFGGQQGDYVAIAGDPCYTCTHETQENYFADTYRYDPEEKSWSRLRDMLMPASHTDFSVVVCGNVVHVIGGQVYKHPEHFGLRLTDLIQSYDVNSDRWFVAGHLPYRLKLPVCTTHQDHLYCITGQRDEGSASAAPGRITSDNWRAPVSSLKGQRQTARNNFLPSLNGKDVALITS
jgi:N-acetylneuraminic acid mutarotase